MIPIVEEVEIIIHRRTAGTGHLTAVMGLRDAVNFADSEIAQGRAVILEIGSESFVVRIGREIVDFVRRVVGGKPRITTISPMAGGENDQAPTAMPPFPPGLSVRDFGGAIAQAEMPREARGRTTAGHIASPDAEMRAWTALVEKIGNRAAQGMLRDGGYSIRSKLWPGILYIVTPQIIKIVNQGMQVSRICIVTTDGGSVWDAVLSRIQLLESGVDGEVQVFATGQLMQG